MGIAHTRWATHGEPSDINSHPHGNKRVSIVHNGIIENYQQLREKMIGRGYAFVSETDTEVLAHMLDYYYQEDPIQAIIKIMHRVKGAYALGIEGMNITVPYKSDAIPFLTEVDREAEIIGAVNTLVRMENGYKGYNTDITGLLRALKSEGIALKDEEVIILGAGGVGRAVAFMCAVNGASKVYLLNRTVEKAQSIADEVNKKVGTQCVEAWCMEDYTKLPDKKYLVLQATSVGLYPNVDDVVLEDEAFYKKVKAGYDLIYNPWETKFMKLVKAQGGQAYNGLKMLLFQAVDAFELWNECKVPDKSAYKAYELLQQAVTKR